MNERVQDDRETVDTTGIVVQEQTNNPGDAAVVVHVKESHLTVGLTEDENEGIKELPVLLNVENVENPSKLLSILTLETGSSTVERTPLQEVITKQSNETVSSETNTSKVVENHKLLGIVALSLLHKLHEEENGTEVEDVTNYHTLYRCEGKVAYIFSYNMK